MHDLDARDRELLAAFREHDGPAPGVAERCFDAVIERVAPPPLPVPWARSIAMSFAIAAAVLLMMRGVATGVHAMRDADASVHTQAESAVRSDGQPPSQATEKSDSADASPRVKAAEPTPAVAPEPVPPEPTPATATSSDAPRASATRASAPDLAADLALLAAAKRAADPSERLALLQRHAREHATSKLAEERDVLVIETLCALGRAEAAKTQAAAFAKRHPQSAFASRVAKSCAGAGG